MEWQLGLDSSTTIDYPVNVLGLMATFETAVVFTLRKGEGKWAMQATVWYALYGFRLSSR